MASGSFQGGGSYIIAKINWSSSAGTGGSNVSATLIAQNINYTYAYAHLYGGYNVTINGNQKSGSGAALSSSQNGAATLLSHTVWVAYTGNKSIGISGYFNGNGISISGNNLGERSCSSTVALDKVGSIPSIPAMTAPTTATVAENATTITVKWNASSSYNNSGNYRVDVSINGGAFNWVSGDLAWGTTSWTYTIPEANRTQGATFRFQVCCGNDVGWSDHSYSGTVTLNKLNAPTIGNIATYNPYQTATLTVPLTGGGQTNGDTAFTRRCDLYQGNTLLASCATPTNGNTSASITYAAANYATRLGSKAYSGTFRIVAWVQNSRGARSGYVEKNFTVNLNLDGNAKPTLGTVTISGGALGYPASCFITGISSLGISLGNAALNRAPSGTTLTYKVSCTGGGEKTGQTVNFGSLSAGVKDITITVTDSRGLSNSTTRQVRFQAYTNPAIGSMKAQRVDNEQTSATITYGVTYCNIYAYSTNVSTQGAQLNGISYQKYQLNGSGNWIGHTSGGKITGLSTDMPYTFNLCIADKVKTSNWIYSSVIIPTVKKFMSWRKWGIGLGCVPENGYTLDVSGKARLRGDVNISHKGSYWIGGADNGTINFVGAVNNISYFPMLSAKTYSGHRVSLGIYQNSFKIIGLKGDRTANGLDSEFTYNPDTGNTTISGVFTAQKGIVSNSNITCSGSISSTGALTTKDCRQKGYESASSGSDKAMYWHKIGMVTLTARYQNADVSLMVRATDYGTSTVSQALLMLRVKQQEPMGSACAVQIVLDACNLYDSYFKNEDFVATVEENSATATKIQLWGRIRNTYTKYVYTTISVYHNFVYDTSMALVSTTGKTPYVTAIRPAKVLNEVWSSMYGCTNGNEFNIITNTTGSIWFNYRIPSSYANVSKPNEYIFGNGTQGGLGSIRTSGINTVNSAGYRSVFGIDSNNGTGVINTYKNNGERTNYIWVGQGGITQVGADTFYLLNNKPVTRTTPPATLKAYQFQDVSAENYLQVQLNSSTGRMAGVSYNVSDISYKNSLTISKHNAIDLIKNINIYDFYWNNSNRHQKFGFLSQQLELIDDELVTSVYDNDDDETLMPREDIILPMAIKAIKELNDEVENLKGKIKELEAIK